MQISYYRIKFPSTCPTNKFECPIEYILKKYGLDNYLPIPRTKTDSNGEIIAAIPSELEIVFRQLMDEEDCFVRLIKTEEYNNSDFKNTSVYEVNEKINGENVTKLSIFKRLS